MRRACIVFGLLCVLSVCGAGQACQNAAGAISVSGPDAVIHGGAGSTVLKVQNPQNSQATLQLSVGPFTNQTSHSVLEVTVELTPADGAKSLPTTLGQQQSTEIVAKLTKLSDAGLSSAPIFNSGRCIGVLRAINNDVPLNITVEGDGAGTTALLLRKGRGAELVLKNSDALTYATIVSLSFDGATTSVAPVIFGPNSTRIVQFSPDDHWFDSRTCIRPNPAKLNLEVRLLPAAATDSPQATASVTPVHGPIPVNVQLAKHSPQGYQWISFWIVFIVLLLGGLASLALNTLLPNLLKKLDYKNQLQAVADATTTVSTRVDSRLRVLLRLERNRLEQLLESIGPFAANSADVFQQITAGLPALTKRVEAAQGLDDLRARFDTGAATWPPSCSDMIDCKLQEAADTLRTLALTDKKIDDAKAALDEADAMLKTADDAGAQAKNIAAGHSNLKARVATFQPADYADIKTALPGLFAVLSNTYDDTHPVLPGNCFAVDNAVSRIHVALNFAYARSATTDAAIRDRLKLRQPRLIALLGTLDWRSLKQARHLVQQMEENVYVEDLKDELVAQRASINIDQQVARPYLPVELCICFQDPKYNQAKALEELTCDWLFVDDNLTETGWSVCHYFLSPGNKTIKATIPLPGGAAPASVPDKVLPVRGRSASESGSRWFAEGLRFGIAFLIALIGLLAGAQDQLAKLDVLPAIIAVFLLGFGADSIKNILGQPSAATKP